MELSLESNYVTEDGTILISGVQALVRLPMDQHRADRRAGLGTATLVSGYRGSPLGGLDHELQRRERLLRDHEIRFLPGINEDLGATAVFGTQTAGLFPRPKYDGVLGMWYGKAPGVNRSGDVFKHATASPREAEEKFTIGPSEYAAPAKEWKFRIGTSPVARA